VTDALAGFAAGCLMGNDAARCAEALWSYAPAGMRQQHVDFAGATHRRGLLQRLARFHGGGH
jgi:hypothetical protein